MRRLFVPALAMLALAVPVLLSGCGGGLPPGQYELKYYTDTADTPTCGRSVVYEVAVRFSAALLEDYAGGRVVAIKFCSLRVACTLKLYGQATSPGSERYSRPVTFAELPAAGWHEFAVSDTVTLNEGEDLWATVTFADGSTLPMGFQNLAASEGDWYRVDGGAWTHETGYTWKIGLVVQID